MSGRTCVIALALGIAGCGETHDRASPLLDPKFEKDAAIENPNDLDKDGFDPEMGDCNEDDALVNPGAFEYVGNDLDDNCDEVVDDGYADCDSGKLSVSEPLDAAKAMNVCPPEFVVEAKYAEGTNALQRAIRANLGPNVKPTSGATMLALSNGRVAIPGEPGFVQPWLGTGYGTSSARPASYPDNPACPKTTSVSVNDLADFVLELRAPTNAKSLSWDSRFFSGEYPRYFCSPFNDAFAAVVTSKRYYRENVAYGPNGEWLSVNVSFWEICDDLAPDGTNPGYDGCKIDPSTIEGSGYGEPDAHHGATRWLSTTIPVDPGEELTIRFAIWDESDDKWDSLVLLDNFRWDIQPAEKETTKPVE